MFQRCKVPKCPPMNSKSSRWTRNNEAGPRFTTSGARGARSGTGSYCTRREEGFGILSYCFDHSAWVGKRLEAQTFIASRIPSVKSEDSTTTRTQAFESGVVKISRRKRSSALHLPSVSGWWRSEVCDLSELRARDPKGTTKDLHLPPHRQRELE